MISLLNERKGLGSREGGVGKEGSWVGLGAGYGLARYVWYWWLEGGLAGARITLNSGARS